MLKICSVLRNAPIQPAKCIVRSVFVTGSQKVNSPAPENPEQSEPEEEFEAIFRFPHMRMLVLLNRLKVYQSIAAAVAAPVAFTLNHFDVIASDAAIAACALSNGVSACLPLYGLSYFFKDIVGYIYLNKDSTKTKIAYLNFWGKRADIVVNTDDIIPFSEQPTSFTDKLYVNLSRYSTKHKLRVMLRFGAVLNDERFTQIFSKPAYY